MSDKTQNHFYGLLKESLWPLVPLRADIETKVIYFLRGKALQKHCDICLSYAKHCGAAQLSKLEVSISHKDTNHCIPASRAWKTIWGVSNLKLFKCCSTGPGYHIYPPNLAKVKHNYEMWLLFKNSFFHSRIVSELILPVFKWIGQGSFHSPLGWNVAAAM